MERLEAGMYPSGQADCQSALVGSDSFRPILNSFMPLGSNHHPLVHVFSGRMGDRDGVCPST